MSNITINPALTTSASGTFSIASKGLVQGTAFPDPAYRNWLKSGVLLVAETLPMWGGVGVYQNVPGDSSSGPAAVLGCTLGRATSLASTKKLSGFSVFDQSYGMINTPQSPVPLSGGGGQVVYYELGSRARVAVKADPNLASLAGGLVSASVSWDFDGQMLIPYSAPSFSSGSYDTATGIVTLNTAANHGLLPGDEIVVSAAAGTGSYAAVNGRQTLIAGTATTVLKFTIAAGLTITLSGATLDTGGALAVTVLDIQGTGCQVVSYDAGTGFATWDYNGAAAVIQL